MSLKDAIREAADERHKQENSPNPTPSEAAHKVTEPSPTPDLSQKAEQSAATKAQLTPNALLASSKSSIAASSNAVNVEGESKDESAALTVRVPRRHRIHWLISAKKEGTSLTAAITEALNARYGEPSE